MESHNTLWGICKTREAASSSGLLASLRGQHVLDCGTVPQCASLLGCRLLFVSLLHLAVAAKIVISSNMVLNVPMPDELMRNSKRAFSSGPQHRSGPHFAHVDLGFLIVTLTVGPWRVAGVCSVLLWSLPTFVLVAALTSAWTLLCLSCSQAAARKNVTVVSERCCWFHSNKPSQKPPARRFQLQ